MERCEICIALSTKRENLFVQDPVCREFRINTDHAEGSDKVDFIE